MSVPKNILITGANGYWGGRLVRRLEPEPGYRVLAVDMNEPETPFERAKFMAADIRNPLLADLFRAEKVDIVCHPSSAGAGTSEHALDLDVTDMQKVLEVCAQTGVRKVVLQSSTLVYGARPDNPAFMTERQPLRAASRYAYIRHLVEIENFAREFTTQNKNVAVLSLRFAGILGPTARTPLAGWLREPLVPTLLGFDPLIQVIHEDDVIEAMAHAVAVDIAGPFNVAAEGALTLAKLIRMAGRHPLPIFHPFAYGGLKFLGSVPAGLRHYAPPDPDYLRYACVADLSQMRETLGFSPSFTAEETIQSFAEAVRLSPFLNPMPGMQQAEERLRRVINLQRQAQQGNE